MTTKEASEARLSWRSDWWLWPTAVALTSGGWRQALWTWENIQPKALAPFWLLLWTGAGIAGLAVLFYGFARRWQPVAWVATLAWAAVPGVYAVAEGSSGPAEGWEATLHSFAPLWMLLLLGIGLSGAMMSVSHYVGRRWPISLSNGQAWREGFWSGLFAAICGWLLIYRLFSLASVAILGGGLVLIETYLVLSELPSAKAKPDRESKASK